MTAEAAPLPPAAAHLISWGSCTSSGVENNQQERAAGEALQAPGPRRQWEPSPAEGARPWVQGLQLSSQASPWQAEMSTPPFLDADGKDSAVLRDSVKLI